MTWISKHGFSSEDCGGLFDDKGYIEEDLHPLVYDFSTGYMKVGFSGDDAPRGMFKSVIGRPKHPGIIGMDAKDCFVGDEAEAKRGILNLNFPMPTDGSSVNFTDLEKLIHHCPYNELCVAPEEHPLMFTPFYNTTFEMFNSISEILFEEFGHPALYCADDTVLSLATHGRESGCSVDLGYGGITCTCIYESYPIAHSKLVLEDQVLTKPRTRIGGELITEVLSKLLVEKGYFLPKPTSAEKEIIRDIKEKLCFVTENRELVRSLSGFSSSSSESENDDRMKRKNCDENKLYEYELPDGKKLKLGKELYHATEILFRPNLIGYDLPGIHELIKSSIEQTERELHQKMYQNIVASGGSSMFYKFPERLKNELLGIVSGDKAQLIKKVHCEGNFEERDATWIGGSIISSLSSFRKSWVGMNELTEIGNYRIMKTKCQMMTGKNDQIGILKQTLRYLDPDLKERLEYVFCEFCGEGGDDDDDEIKMEFVVNIRYSFDTVKKLKFRFKSLFLLL